MAWVRLNNRELTGEADGSVMALVLQKSLAASTLWQSL